MIEHFRKLYVECYPAATLVFPAVLFFVILSGGCALSIFQPKVYESQARLWIQPKLPTEQQSDESVYSPLAYSFTNALATACELIKSESVLNDSVAELRKRDSTDNHPGLSEISTKLSVVPAKNADVVVVSYRASNPKLAMEIVRAVVDSFVRVNARQMSGSASRSREFLQAQLDKARAQDLSARNELKKFQDEHGAVSLDSQVTNLLSQESAKNKEIEDAKLAVSQHQDRLDEIRSRLRISQDQLDAAAKLAEDDVLVSFREEIAKHQVHLVELSGKLRDEHPRVLSIKRKVQRLKAAMQTRARELAGESGASLIANQLPLSDSNQQKQLDNLLDEESALRTEETHLARASSALSGIREQLKTIPSLQLKHVELVRQADVTAKQLTEAEGNFRTAEAKEYVATKNSNIQIIDYPTLSATPISPNIPMLIGLSFILASAVAGGAYFLLVSSLNPYITSIREILDSVRLPMLGWVTDGPRAMQLQDIMPAMQRLRLNWKSSRKSKIVVSSCDPGDGATMVAAGLAVSFAQAGSRVILIDANLSDPQVHEMFELDSSPGLSDYLSTGNPDMLLKVIRTPFKGKQNLQVITAGTSHGSNTPVDSPTFQSLLQKLQSEVDVLIIDTPAVSKAADAMSLLGSECDLLFVSALRHSMKNSVRLAAAEIGRQKVSSGGIFLYGVSESDVIAATAPTSTATERPRAEANVW
jgi:uncharacterized protein involved in exopolysaccharide biosynthesis/Mrp family chromosome partitioning ATPase